MTNRRNKFEDEFVISDDELKDLFSRVLKLGSHKKKSLDIPDIAIDSDEEERRTALKELLLNLSSIKPENALSQEEIKRVIDFFNILYGNEPKFRHNYSDICDIIFNFMDDCGPDDLDNGVPYQANNLSYNINLICTAMRKDNNNSQSTQLQSVYKLCDHIELERTRLQHYVRQSKEIAAFTQARRDLEKNFQKQASKLRNEFITILGIFAAIVLVFNGAVNFSTASISALGTQSGLRAIILMCSLVGFVLVNTISILLFFLWKMSNNNEKISGTLLILYIFINLALILLIIFVFLLAIPKFRLLIGLSV